MIPAEVRSTLSDILGSTPVDVRSAAQRLGLEVYAVDLPPKVSGVLLREKSYGTSSGFVILVDRSEPNVRQRFTAAHELGHYVLHRDSVGDRLEDNYLLRSEGMSNRQEVEANKFAAALLMPMELIHKKMSEGVTSVGDLARTFAVSQIAMSIRLGLPT